MKQFISSVINYPQSLVDRIGMYRTVTVALLGILLASLVAGATGMLSYGAGLQLIVVVPAVLYGLLLNIVLAQLWQVHANHESAIITTLILFFLFIPQAALFDNWPLFAAITLGLLSKFLLAWRKQHVANPVAMGAVLVVVGVWLVNVTTGTDNNTDIYSWWVSNPTLFWPILILGSLVVMKVRKWTPVLWFLAVSVVVFLFEEARFFGADFDWFNSAELFLFSWPALFLAFFMLTEPFTMPPTKKTQAFYGALVGVLMHTTIFVDLFPMTPELALVIGNLAMQPFRLQQKLYLTLVERRKLAEATYEFVFKKPADFQFTAGQYLEWMLPHQADGRGERRYFTIASSPTEPYVRLALKVVDNGSTYKKELMQLKPGDVIIASQLAGDFVLPADTSQKLGFIAGGIGVTPFSSHLAYMFDSGEARDTILLYCANTVGELAYADTFKSYTASLPLEIIPVIASEPVTAPLEQGFVTIEMLERRVPDYQQRHWYLSGPPPMVNAYTVLLRSAGVPSRHITKDFFPGLA
jgi:ferredoxin-NADP reductase